MRRLFVLLALTPLFAEDPEPVKRLEEAAAVFSEIPHVSPEDDLVTSKLKGLFINSPSLPRSRRSAASMRPPQCAGTICSAARRSATTVTWNRFGQTPVGICIAFGSPY